MNILAFGAHPDDIEILCAGTLAKYADQGHTIHLAIMCQGDCGSATLPPEEIAAIRLREAQASAQLIGASLHLIGFPDLRIHTADEDKDRIIEVIRRARPQVILTHDPNDYMIDHQLTGRLTEECAFMATLPNIKTESPAHMENAVIYYMDTLAGVGFEPSEYVEITEVFETKRRMLRCHISQTVWLKEHDAVDIEDQMETQARFRGLQAGVRYAEAFRHLHEWGRETTRRLLP